MKYIIVLVVFVCCAYAVPSKDQLINRAVALEKNIQNEIQKLEAMKRNKLASALMQEEKNLTTLSKKLHNVDDTDDYQRFTLNENLITIEVSVQRAIREITWLFETADRLLAYGQRLKALVKSEIELLVKKNSTNHKGDITYLKALELTVERDTDKIKHDQTMNLLEFYERDLRTVETRINEKLRELHLVTPTGAPSTGSTTNKPTARPSTPKHNSARPSTTTTTKHNSTRPSTPKHISARHSTSKPNTTNKV